MSVPDNPEAADPGQLSSSDRLTCLTGMLCPVMLALGYWIMVITTVVTGELKPVTLIIAGLEAVAAWLGVHGWRRRAVIISWAALAVMIGAFMLSKLLV
ncbi:hypothetical protein [Streptomyces sp. DASNCL29]|uniref:hypothetical protein n=1 Tax=Streptomyces sp. DASNCL29 TaxID=2583819 RepID=UPI00110F7563|nr:hypothetical protein [Streptomyces sp. DASNCL29]TMU90722.1 hypothetical protein FGK60_45305 [Streptomyces sp. DASNCL29]